MGRVGLGHPSRFRWRVGRKQLDCFGDPLDPPEPVTARVPERRSLREIPRHREGLSRERAADETLGRSGDR